MLAPCRAQPLLAELLIAGKFTALLPSGKLCFGVLEHPTPPCLPTSPGIPGLPKHLGTPVGHFGVS